MGGSHEHKILHWSKEITYSLWMKSGEIPWAHDSVLIEQDQVLPMNEKQGDSISTRFCIDPTKITHFLWVKHGEISSAHDSTLIQGDHVLPVGETSGDPMSTRIWRRSRTFCGWKTGKSNEHTSLHWFKEIVPTVGEIWEIPWVHDCALIQRDHVLPVGETSTGRSHEQTIRHWSNEMTYCLWSMGRSHDYTILHWSKEITYMLWIKNGEIPSANNSAFIFSITYFL